MVELRQVEAKLALLTGERRGGARIMSEVLDDPVLGAPDISRGASEQILARGAAARSGKTEAPASGSRAAAREFEREGRLRAAVDAWRLGIGRKFRRIS